MPSARGRGLAAAALTALTSFAWTIEGLHRIELYIEPWNTGSVKTAERAGFEREGLLRSHQEIGRRRRDMLLYAAIREGPAESARLATTANLQWPGRLPGPVVSSLDARPDRPPLRPDDSSVRGPMHGPVARHERGHHGRHRPMMAAPTSVG